MQGGAGLGCACWRSFSKGLVLTEPPTSRQKLLLIPLPRDINCSAICTSPVLRSARGMPGNAPAALGKSGGCPRAEASAWASQNQSEDDGREINSDWKGH